MGIYDIKIPKMKFKKMKINTDMLDRIEELDIEDMEKTHYKTVKEFFLRSIKTYPNRPCILEKPNHKEPYKTITYEEFGSDVLALGTALIHLLNLKDKRVIIIGETRIWLVCIIYGNVMWSGNCSTNR